MKTRKIGTFQRSDNKGKINFNLIPTWFLVRLAKIYTEGAELYGEGNWMSNPSPEVMKCAKESAWRHFVAWLDGDKDEDHAIKVVWNIILYEYCKLALNKK